MNPLRDHSVLLIASSPGFTERMSVVLRVSDLKWAVLKELREMFYNQPKDLTFLLIDGNDSLRTDAIHWTRSISGWSTMPIIVVGGQASVDDQEDANLKHVLSLDSAAQLSSVIRDTIMERVARLTANPGSERRTSFRINCNLSAAVEFPIRVLDISEGGAQVESPASVPPGTIVTFNVKETFTVFPKAIRMEVLYVRPTEDVPPKYRLHGRFADTSPDFRREIRRLLLKLQVTVTQRVLQLTRR